MFIKRKKGASLTALILVAVMVISVVLTNNWYMVKADPVDIGADNYEDDGHGSAVYHADGQEDRPTSFGTVNVPEGCIFEITTDVTVNTLNIAVGGRVIIIDDGTLNVSNLVPAAGADMQFGSGSNVPEGITLYNHDESVFNPDNINMSEFMWNGDGWIDTAPTSKSVVIDIQGLGDDVSYSVYGGSANNPGLLDPVWSYGPMKGYCFDLDTASQFIQVVISGDIPEGKQTFMIVNDNEIASGNYTVSDDKKTISYTINPLDEINNSMIIMFAYENEGDSGIVGDVNKTLFAYNVNVTNEADVENLLAEELYERFLRVPMYGRFGMNTDDHDSCITELKNRIVIGSSSGQVSCTKNDGTLTDITYQNYSVTWGNDSSGNPIVSTIPVYQLTNTKQLIIKAGDSWYVRNADTDQLEFLNQGGESSLIIRGSVPNPENILVGGYGAVYEPMNTQDIYSAYIRHLDVFWNADGQNGLNGETILRFVNTADTYVGICAESATDNLETGGLGTNGVRYDHIWNTGTNGEEAIVFIGWKSITLHSLSAGTGLTTRLITNVELLDDSMSDGINITMDAGNNRATVEFLSNFYDEVPLAVTYDDGTTGNITIIRTGLVIQWQYCIDGQNSNIIPLPLSNTEIQYNYDYEAGEQILIYALYYHPNTDDTLSGSNDLALCVHYADGTIGFIPKTQYIPGAGNSAAVSFFMIGFAPAKTQYEDGNWGEPEIREQTFAGAPFYATVLNSGYDAADDGAFGGVQAGSGQGAYWDGYVHW